MKKELNPFLVQALKNRDADLREARIASENAIACLGYAEKHKGTPAEEVFLEQASDLYAIAAACRDAAARIVATEPPEEVPLSQIKLSKRTRALLARLGLSHPRLEAEAEARKKATLGRQRWARRQRDARRKAAREAAAEAQA